MGLLKQKIARAIQAQKMKQNSKTTIIKSFNLVLSPSTIQIEEPVKMIQESLISPSSSMTNTTKTPSPSKRRIAYGNNIMKNYCRALVNFALSSMAVPYLPKNLEGATISYEKFHQMLSQKKKTINCIKSLRNYLLQSTTDTADMRAFKIMFQRTSEVFLKYFCANWIFNSKVEDRMKHLKYRGKMLRRVQNPEHFTYLEDFVKKEGKESKKKF